MLFAQEFFRDAAFAIIPLALCLSMMNTDPAAQDPTYGISSISAASLLVIFGSNPPL
jgi:hypothetical protein